jgi:shikimate dehydrogenase
VQFAGGRRIGHNTDVTGFAESMQAGLPDVALRRVLQMGAGGAGAATAVALLDLGVERLLVCDLDAGRAQELVGKLKRSFASSRVQAMPAPPGFAEVDGVVNATPMGMSAQPEPPIDTALLAPHQWVADIVYFPLETQLLLAARARGCRTLDGSGMAVYQAADAFEIFTGRIANRPRMLRSFREFTGQASRAESARD